jgi:molecular chaperone HscA
MHLAIDFGTSHTVAVVRREGQQPRALLFDGSPLLPSGVYAAPGGDLHTGRDAERLAQLDPAGFEPHPKRNVDHEVVLIGRHELAPAVLIAAVLGRVARAAAEAGAGPGTPAVLTCPADWGRRRRAVLLRAAELAGLRVGALVDEPVAAGTYCLDILDVAAGQALVVFDFGGGTLDVAAVRREPGGLRVLATGGLDNLGGLDVDAAVAGQLGQVIAGQDPALWQRLAAPADPAALRERRAFWAEVRAAKEMLSRTTTAPVSLPGNAGALHLTREELDRVAGPLVDRAVDETRRLLRDSRIGPAELAGIFLVGGASRMPLVASRLHARLGVAPSVPEQPELPVALGALPAAAAPAPPAPAQGWEPRVADWSDTTTILAASEPAPAAAKAGRKRVLAAALAAVVLLAGGVLWWYATRSPAGPGPNAAGSSPSAAAAKSPGRAVPAGLVTCGERLCPAKENCWGGLVVAGGAASAGQRDCAKKHSWETFAVGFLPADAFGVSHNPLQARADIKALCSLDVLRARLRTPPAGAVEWEAKALPVDSNEGKVVHCLGARANTGETTGSIFRTGA